MPSPKLLRLMQALDGWELNRLDKLLSSPYFNDHEAVLACFRALRSQPDIEAMDKQASRHYVWARMYPGQSYDYPQLRRDCSALIQVIYRFLAMQAHESQELTYRNDLLKALSEKKLDRDYTRQADLQAKALRSEGVPGASSFLAAQQFWKLEHERYERTIRKRGDFSALEQADQALDLYYLLKKLRHYTDALGYESFYSEVAHIAWPSFLDDWVERPEMQAHPLIRAYGLVIKMLSTDDGETHYNALRDMVTDSFEELPSPDLRILFIHLYNFCIHLKINRGDASFYQELFELFKLGLEKGIVLDDGKLDFNYYRTIITTGLRVRAFDWVETFIQDYSPRIPQAHQKNALAFNLAKVYFSKGAYHDVIAQLAQVEHDDLAYSYQSRLLLLKTYYELGEWMSLDSLLDSFHIFMRRKKGLSRDFRKRYLLSLNLVKKMRNLGEYEDKRRAELVREIMRKDPYEKAWMLEKLKAGQGESIST